jgi:hypothetical protein
MARGDILPSAAPALRQSPVFLAAPEAPARLGAPAAWPGRVFCLIVEVLHIRTAMRVSFHNTVRARSEKHH